MNDTMTRRAGLAATVALLLSACAAGGAIDPDSKWYAPPVGTKLTLHQDLEVPADRARVFLQDGAVVSSFTPFKVHCAFEVNEVMPQPQTIKAGEFIVRKVQREESQVVWAEPVRVASAGFGVGAEIGGDGPGDITKLWHLWLSSTAQPNVRRLSCGGVRERPYDARYPTINEIKAALGSLASLELPATGAKPGVAVPEK